MDDFHEPSRDLVVADLALLAGHDLAELPDAFHSKTRGRTSVARISLAERRPIRLAGRGRRGRAAFCPSDVRLRATSEHILLNLEILPRRGNRTSIPPQRAVPRFLHERRTAKPLFSGPVFVVSGRVPARVAALDLRGRKSVL